MSHSSYAEYEHQQSRLLPRHALFFLIYIYMTFLTCGEYSLRTPLRIMPGVLLSDPLCSEDQLPIVSNMAFLNNNQDSVLQCHMHVANEHHKNCFHVSKSLISPSLNSLEDVLYYYSIHILLHFICQSLHFLSRIYNPFLDCTQVK